MSKTKKIIKTTEAESTHQNLEQMSVKELLQQINLEDQSVPFAIQKSLGKIKKLVQAAHKKMLLGGRLFYIGAGTSGRLGIVDACECPPTYG
ncbi:MAG: N-acetylmuramic acid 6-phosphate etherase, partial [Bacteroidia bacterium]